MNVLRPPTDSWWPSPLTSYPNAVYMVAVAQTPIGPFEVVNQRANVAARGGGDFALFVDGDQGDGEKSPLDAYIAYDAWSNSHTITIERLTPDYRDSLAGGRAATETVPRGTSLQDARVDEQHDHESVSDTSLGKNSRRTTSGPISPPHNEAPILFKRQNYYYLFFGHLCCFCREGSGSSVYVARHPLGPWRDTGVDINPVVGSFWFPGARRRVVEAQENFVLRLSASVRSVGSAASRRDGSVGGSVGSAASRVDAGASGEDDDHDVYIYTGDRWGSAADGRKSHDLQYWGVLEFDDELDPPLPKPLQWRDSLVLREEGEPHTDHEQGPPWAVE